MRIEIKYRILFTLFFGLCIISVYGKTEKYRCMWRENPSTTMVVGWNQLSGTNPVLYYDLVDHGSHATAYQMQKGPDAVLPSKGMNNHFVRLSNLQPNTIYYFVIKDSEGVSRRMSFKTAPNNPDTRLSIIAGGDSRNHREARRDANLLVSKLRPHCVMFGGDFTENDSPQQWMNWLDDWQLTISRDGHLIPIISARGNHEMSNQSLVDIFDVKSKDLYYSLTLGGNLLRIYTLNSLASSGGNQKDWLERDLKASTRTKWKFAQYHHGMRPHTTMKSEKDELYMNWAGLFYEHGINLAVESDAHMVKTTWPVRPDIGPGSVEGFIRDDQFGTVYAGEGCWGAPLRRNDDDKSWTRNSGSFNQFKWIFVDRQKIEMRTIQTDGADRVSEVNPNNIFAPPVGIVIWTPSNGDVVTIWPRGESPYILEEEPMFAARGGEVDWDALPKLVCDPSSELVRFEYLLNKATDVKIRLINPAKQEISKIDLRKQSPNQYRKAYPLKNIPNGQYYLVIETPQKVLHRFQVFKN